MAGIQAPFEAGPGEQEVERIVCASMATSSGSLYAQMEQIRAASLRNNSGAGIHAALVCQSGWFVQWAEGPGDALRRLMERVKRDMRHHSPHVVHHSRGVRLLPSPWSMVLSQSTSDAVEFGRRVLDLRKQMEHGRQYAPYSVMRRLSAPLLLPQAQAQDDPEAFHRVGVSSAGSNEAFDLIGWLARHHREAVQRRRFAGESDLDSSSEYVEFMEGGHPCRVIAVARQGLSHGLRRAFLPMWPHYLLLFSGIERLDDALMKRMLTACARIPVRPTLVGIAPAVSTHERMMRMASTIRIDYVAGGLLRADDSAAIWRVMSEQLQRAGPPPSSAWAVIEPRLAA